MSTSNGHVCAGRGRQEGALRLGVSGNGNCEGVFAEDRQKGKGY